MTTKEELEAEWLDAQDEGCGCHTLRHPPCWCCAEGFSVSLEEYIELSMEHQAPSKTEIYDRVMKDMFK